MKTCKVAESRLQQAPRASAGWVSDHIGMDVEPMPLQGCFVLRAPVFKDERGSFFKPFQRTAFLNAGLNDKFDEQFFSRSARGVVRGFHLQSRPAEQWKLVTCLSGEAHDAVVDLRPGSRDFGATAEVVLRAESGMSVLIPPGVGHAFQAIADSTVMAYWVSAEHDAAADTGVRWDSVGIAWSIPVTGVSARDARLPRLDELAGPTKGTR